MSNIKGLDEKFCCECGGVIKAKAELCVLCGCRQPLPLQSLAEPLTTSRWIGGRPHPWRRYFARMLDSMVNGMIIAFIVAIAFFWLWPREAQDFFAYIDQNKYLDILLTVALAIPLNACLIGSTGGTLGKWLFGVNVRDANGKPIGVGAAFYREILVWVKGMGFGIPIVYLFTCGFACSTLSKTGSTTWDRRSSAEVRYRPSGFRQGMGAICGILVWFLVIGGITALNKPQQVASLPRAAVELVNDHQVKVEGAFGLGTASELRRVLDVSPNIRFVELESKIGGYVDEGLAVYDLIRAKHLYTFTQTVCISACTIAYMGGERRFLADDASLQFHEWEINGVRVERDSDMARRLLVAAGISADFATRAFAGRDLWVPNRATLIAAGVITHAMDGKAYR